MSNIRGHMANIRRIYVEWSDDIRRTYGEHTSICPFPTKIHQTYGEHTLKTSLDLLTKIYFSVLQFRQWFEYLRSKTL